MFALSHNWGNFVGRLAQLMVPLGEIQYFKWRLTKSATGAQAALFQNVVFNVGSRFHLGNRQKETTKYLLPYISIIGHMEKRGFINGLE